MSAPRPPGSMASRLRWVLACLVACVLPPAWGDGTVQLIASEEGGAYREAAEAFRAAFGAVHPLRSWQLAQLDGAQLRALSGEHDLIVAIGLRAARTLALHYGGQAAVLTLMLPRASAERLPWPAGVPRRKVSHVYIDQPASRTLAPVRAALRAAPRSLRSAAAALATESSTVSVEAPAPLPMTN